MGTTGWGVGRGIFPESTSFLPMGWFHSTCLIWNIPDAQLLTNVFASLALAFKAKSTGLLRSISYVCFLAPRVYHRGIELFHFFLSPLAQNLLSPLSVVSAPCHSPLPSYEQTVGGQRM